MPEIPDVVAGNTIESAWGNQTRDRSVQRYSTEASRDSLTPVPAAGDLAYITGDDQFQIFDGSVWQNVDSRTVADGRYVLIDGGGIITSGSLIVIRPGTGVMPMQTTLGSSGSLTLTAAVDTYEVATSIVVAGIGGTPSGKPEVLVRATCFLNVSVGAAVPTWTLQLFDVSNAEELAATELTLTGTNKANVALEGWGQEVATHQLRIKRSDVTGTQILSRPTMVSSFIEGIVVTAP